MRTLYVVFDKLPKKSEGGLVETYARFVQELKDDFDIKLLSVFDNGKNDIDEFNTIPQISLSSINIDNRFYRAFSYLTQKQILKFFWALFSTIWFFISIPILRLRTKKILQDKIVIASSPAAAIFLSKKVRYILEIHTNYEYFWGSNLLGRAQVALIPKPRLTLFRNQTDAKKGNQRFPSSYIYNGFNEKNLPTPNFDSALVHNAVFVGRLEPPKNPMLLIDIAKLVHTKVPDFVLDIYGTGSLEEKLRSTINHDKLSSFIHLKGFCEDKSIYSKYNQTWLTSNYEGFGLVITESMANATPVISTNWGAAVFEIIKDKETGFIVNDKSEFTKRAIDLFNNVELRNFTGRNARKDFLERFSATKNKERWIEIIDFLYGN